MKKRGLLFTLVLLLATALLLTACGGGSSQPPAQNNTSGGDAGTPQETGDNKTAQNVNLSILTGGTGGTYYPLGGQIAQIIQSKVGYGATAQTSNASEENVKLIEAQEAEIAFTQTDIANYAVNGLLMFEGKPLSSLMGIGTLYPETVQIVTLADSGINSIEDLRGKKVSVGAPASGTFANAQQILEIHGITMDDINPLHLSFAESVDGLQDGNIDAAVVTAGTPTSAIESLAAQRDVNIISISDEKINELIEAYPFYAKDVIPAGTYGLANDVQTVAVMAMLVTHKDMDEEIIYNVTKALYENTNEIGHAKGEFIKAETALDGIGIEVHPGALKYYQEKGLAD